MLSYASLSACQLFCFVNALAHWEVRSQVDACLTRVWCNQTRPTSSAVDKAHVEPGDDLRSITESLSKMASMSFSPTLWSNDIFGWQQGLTLNYWSKTSLTCLDRWSKPSYLCFQLWSRHKGLLELHEWNRDQASCSFSYFNMITIQTLSNAPFRANPQLISNVSKSTSH